MEKWLKYLREELPAVAFKCSAQEQRLILGWKSLKGAKNQAIFCRQAIVLVQKLLLRITPGVRWYFIREASDISFPCLCLVWSSILLYYGCVVGKNNLINSLKRYHVVRFGASPGLHDNARSSVRQEC